VHVWVIICFKIQKTLGWFRVYEKVHWIWTTLKKQNDGKCIRVNNQGMVRGAFELGISKMIITAIELDSSKILKITLKLDDYIEIIYKIEEDILGRCIQRVRFVVKSFEEFFLKLRNVIF